MPYLMAQRLMPAVFSLLCVLGILATVPVHANTPVYLNSKAGLDQAPFIVHYRVESNVPDGLYEYYLELLDAAFHVTQAEYGAYELKPVFDTNFVRALKIARSNSLENFLFGTSYSKGMAKEFAFAPLPIDLGIMSYRVCFSSKSRLEALSRVESLEQLKQYSIGQGKNWLDVGVLRANGFSVVEHINYSTLFPSVARGRFDLFCRSVNEIMPEWNAHKDIENLAIEQSFAIYYSFPRFFWTNRSNALLLARLTKGLTLNLESGLALNIWKKHNLQSVHFSNLRGRRVFVLKNPQLEGVDLDVDKYFYDPFAEPHD